MFISLIETWLKKYKFDVKILKSNVANVSIFFNEKVERNAMTKNQKFEQIEQIAIVQNKKKTFFNNVINNNNTCKRNSFRICRFNSIDQINFIFFFTNSVFNISINIFENIFQIYQQLFHVRFFNIFV